MSIWQRPSSPSCSGKAESPHRKARLFAVLIPSLTVLFFVSLALGSTSVDLGAALSALLAGDFGSPDLRIVLYVRLPRVMGALVDRKSTL